MTLERRISKMEVIIRKNNKELRKYLDILGLSLSDNCYSEEAQWLSYNTALRDSDDDIPSICGIGCRLGISDERTVQERLDGYVAHLNDINVPYVDCEDNEELFLAIAAINDKDDYMQYFNLSCNMWWPGTEPIHKGKVFLCPLEHRYPEEYRGHEDICNTVPPADKLTIDKLVLYKKQLLENQSIIKFFKQHA